MDNKLLLAQEGEAVQQLPASPGAYVLKNEDDQIIYAGSTCNLRMRRNDYNSSLGRSQCWNDNLQVAADNSSIVTMDVIPTETKEEALNIEQNIVNEMHGNGILSNKAKDVRSPHKDVPLSSEHKEKLRQTNLGNQYSKGRKLSQDHREALIKAITNREVSEETKEKMAIAATGNQRAAGFVWTDQMKISSSETKGTAITIDGTDYRSYNHAAGELGLSPQTVLNRCKSDKFKNWNTRGQ